MATVTGYTAAKTEELMNEQIIDANIVSGNLILTTRGGQDINVGSVIGPQGPPGTDESIVICTSTTRPTPFAGLAIYETNTFRFMIYDGSAWQYRGGIWLCTSLTRPSSIAHNGMEIYETDTKRTYIWDGDSWELTSATIDPDTNNQLTKTANGLMVDKRNAGLTAIGWEGSALGPLLIGAAHLQWGCSVRTTNVNGDVRIDFPTPYQSRVSTILITAGDLISVSPGDDATCQMTVIRAVIDLSGFWVRCEFDTNNPIVGGSVCVNWLSFGL